MLAVDKGNVHAPGKNRTRNPPVQWLEREFFHEREARVVDFLCFLPQKREIERELRARANYWNRKSEKRRTLRKTNFHRDSL